MGKFKTAALFLVSIVALILSSIGTPSVRADGFGGGPMPHYVQPHPFAIVGCGSDPYIYFLYGTTGETVSMSWATNTQINGSVSAVTVNFHIPTNISSYVIHATAGETVHVYKDQTSAQVTATILAQATFGSQWWSYSGAFSVSGSRGGFANYGPIPHDTTGSGGPLPL